MAGWNDNFFLTVTYIPELLLQYSWIKFKGKGFAQKCPEKGTGYTLQHMILLLNTWLVFIINATNKCLTDPLDIMCSVSDCLELLSLLACTYTVVDLEGVPWVPWNPAFWRACVTYLLCLRKRNYVRERLSSPRAIRADDVIIAERLSVRLLIVQHSQLAFCRAS